MNHSKKRANFPFGRYGPVKPGPRADGARPSRRRARPNWGLLVFMVVSFGAAGMLVGVLIQQLSALLLR